MQYFWIVCHNSEDETMIGNDFIMDKIFLQPHQAIEWGRRKATQNSGYSYKLYKQPITRTGKIAFVEYLEPFTVAVKRNIKAIEQPIEYNDDTSVEPKGIIWDDSEI